MTMLVRVFRNDVEEPLLNMPEDEYLEIEEIILGLWRVPYSSSLEFRLHNEYLICFFQDMPINIPEKYLDEVIVIGKKEYYLVGDKLPVKVDWADKLEIVFDDEEYNDDHP
jgi:hypothetical protein